jgi:hypothetical protein
MWLPGWINYNEDASPRSQECEFTVYVNPEFMGYKIVKILYNLINNVSGLPGILL